MGLAERSGEIKRGDVLVGVNKHSFRGQSLGDVLRVLSQISVCESGVTLHFASALSAGQGYSAFRFQAAASQSVTTRPYESQFGGERVLVSELAVAAPGGASTLSSTVTASACPASRQPVLDYSATHASVEDLAESSSKVSDVVLSWSSQGQTKLATEVDRTIASHRTTKTSLASLLGISMNFFIKWSKGKAPISASDHAAQVLLAWLASCGKAQSAAACVAQGTSGLARLLDSLRARAALPFALPVINVKGKALGPSSSSSVAVRMLHEQDDPFLAPVSGNVVPPHCPGPTTLPFLGSIKVPSAPQRSPSVNGSRAPPVPGEAVSAFPRLPVHRGRRLRPGDTSEVSVKHSRVGIKYQCVVPAWTASIPLQAPPAPCTPPLPQTGSAVSSLQSEASKCTLPDCTFVGEVALSLPRERAIAEERMPAAEAGSPVDCIVPGMRELLRRQAESATASPPKQVDEAAGQAVEALRIELPLAGQEVTAAAVDAPGDASGSMGDCSDSDGDASIRRGKRKRVRRDLTALEAPLIGQQASLVSVRDGTDDGQPFFPADSIGLMDLQLLRQEVDDDFRPHALRNRQQQVKPSSKVHGVRLTPYGSDSFFEAGWKHQDPTPVGGIQVWAPLLAEPTLHEVMASSRSVHVAFAHEVTDRSRSLTGDSGAHFGFESPPPVGRKHKTATLASVLPGATSIIMAEAYKSIWPSCAAHNAQHCAEVELASSGMASGRPVPFGTPLTLLHTNGWFDVEHGNILAKSIVSCSEPEPGAVATYAPSVGLPGVHVHEGGASAELMEHVQLCARSAPVGSDTSGTPAKVFSGVSDFAQAYDHHAELAYTILFCCDFDKVRAASQLETIFEAARQQVPAHELRPLLEERVAALTLAEFPPVIDGNAWRTWTQKEAAIFQDCMDSMGPDMPAISKFIGSRCVRECVQFYYAGFKGAGSSYGVAQGLAEWHGYIPAIWDAAGSSTMSSVSMNSCMLPPGTHRSWKRLHAAFAAPLVEFHWDVCLVCAQGGNLIMCDSCNLSYHLSCLKISEDNLDLDAPWACPACALDFNSEQVALKTPFRTLTAASSGSDVLADSTKLLAVQDDGAVTEGDASSRSTASSKAKVRFSPFACAWARQHVNPLAALREARKLVKEGCEAIEVTRRNRQRVRGEVVRARSMVRHAELPKDNVLRYVAIQAKRGKKRAAEEAMFGTDSKVPRQTD